MQVIELHSRSMLCSYARDHIEDYNHTAQLRIELVLKRLNSLITGSESSDYDYSQLQFLLEHNPRTGEPIFADNKKISFRFKQELKPPDQSFIDGSVIARGWRNYPELQKAVEAYKKANPSIRT